MKIQKPTADYQIESLFPLPLYITKRDPDLNSTEKKEIEDIIKEGSRKVGNLDHYTDNTYIFNTKLKNLKDFCEQHINTYVKQVINPRGELDFYITQSWLNVVEPGGIIPLHWHSNSIISGVFYIATTEDDRIIFYDTRINTYNMIHLEPKEYNFWNADNRSFSVNNNSLVLFPSWMKHNTYLNKKASTDRISLAFNVFAKGNFGMKGTLNELIL